MYEFFNQIYRRIFKKASATSSTLFIDNDNLPEADEVRADAVQDENIPIVIVEKWVKPISELGRFLERFGEVARPKLLKSYSPWNCILASRVTIDVLRHFGLTVEERAWFSFTR